MIQNALQRNSLVWSMWQISKPPWKGTASAVAIRTLIEDPHHSAEGLAPGELARWVVDRSASAKRATTDLHLPFDQMRSMRHGHPSASAALSNAQNASIAFGAPLPSAPSFFIFAMSYIGVSRLSDSRLDQEPGPAARPPAPLTAPQACCSSPQPRRCCRSDTSSLRTCP